MTHLRPMALASAFLVVLGAGSVQSHEYALGKLKIAHPWTRPAPAGSATAVGYFKVTNEGATPDRLVAVSSTAAERVEIHQTTMTGGVMRMAKVTEGVAIAPGQTLSFEPGSYHLMLVKPRNAFVKGDHIPLSLTFQKAGRADVQLMVQTDAPGAANTPSPSHDAMKMN